MNALHPSTRELIEGEQLMANENKKEQSATGSSQGCRMNAKAVLQEQAKRMEKELESIETLPYTLG